MKRSNKKKRKSGKRPLFMIGGIALFLFGLFLIVVGFEGSAEIFPSAIVKMAEKLYIEGEPNLVVGFLGIGVAILGVVLCVIGWKKFRD